MRSINTLLIIILACLFFTLYGSTSENRRMLQFDEEGFSIDIPEIAGTGNPELDRLIEE